MAIRIPTDVEVLAKCRFAISPAFEVVATLRGRQTSTLPAHARGWYARALARLDARTVDLLHALVPTDHPYVLNFLTPHPGRSRETPDRIVAAIAATPGEEIRRDLSFIFSGQVPNRAFGISSADLQRYRRWQRPLPRMLADLLEGGEIVLAEEAAAAIGRFIDAAIAEEWLQLTAVLDADIAHRSEVMAAHGFAAMLGGLGEGLHWSGGALTLDRPFDEVVDWVDDGLLLTPCTALVGPIRFTAKRPRTPLLIYPARGIAALRSRPLAPGRGEHVRELIGMTRLGILRRLDTPHTTQELSQLDGHAPATVSYHLGILHRGGLVASRRSGRGVLYRRTPLGTALLSGELQQSDR